MEMRDLQCDVDEIITFKRVLLLGFYKLCLPAGGFPLPSDNVWGRLGSFISTYVCDSCFKKWKW
jgi:hypothetical protein